MRGYFAEAPAADAAWAVFFLIGARLKRLIAPRLVATWALEETETAGWMFEECYAAAGDVGEVIALLIDGQRGGAPPATGGLSLSRLVEENPSSLGAVLDWQAEWKWDGIRAQLVRRGSQHWLWSRGEELITARFPDLAPAFVSLDPGTVLDGEVLAFREGAPLPFSVLQRRIGRQKLTPSILDEAPAAFMAYDLLEEGGIDLRDRPLSERRERLVRLATGRARELTVSPQVEAASWEELAALRRSARARGVEGLMLKRRSSPYQTGRRRGDWWKWKIDPYSIDAVLVYAQPGNGRRASVLTDMTFGVWHEGELLPVAKAYSGLTDEEIDRIDRWIRQHTIERFGPVRHVEPAHVFELHFEGIAESGRHKSGIAVRFPRIARRRTDRKPEDADTLESLRALLRHAAT